MASATNLGTQFHCSHHHQNHKFHHESTMAAARHFEPICNFKLTIPWQTWQFIAIPTASPHHKKHHTPSHFGHQSLSPWAAPLNPIQFGHLKHLNSHHNFVNLRNHHHRSLTHLMSPHHQLPSRDPLLHRFCITCKAQPPLSSLISWAHRRHHHNLSPSLSPTVGFNQSPSSSPSQRDLRLSPAKTHECVNL